MRSSASSGSSMARRSRSQPAFWAILLSAKQQRALFGLAQPLEHDHRHLAKAEKLRGLEATVPGR